MCRQPPGGKQDDVILRAGTAVDLIGACVLAKCAAIRDGDGAAPRISAAPSTDGR